MQEEDRLARVGNWKAARSESVDSLPSQQHKNPLNFYHFENDLLSVSGGRGGRARKQKQELLSCGWNSTGSEKWLSRVRSLNRIKQWKCFSPPFRKYGFFSIFIFECGVVVAYTLLLLQKESFDVHIERENCFASRLAHDVGRWKTFEATNTSTDCGGKHQQFPWKASCWRSHRCVGDCAKFFRWRNSVAVNEKYLKYFRLDIIRRREFLCIVSFRAVFLYAPETFAPERDEPSGGGVAAEPTERVKSTKRRKIEQVVGAL